jgi:hypothetical protein
MFYRTYVISIPRKHVTVNRLEPVEVVLNYQVMLVEHEMRNCLWFTVTDPRIDIQLITKRTELAANPAVVPLIEPRLAASTFGLLSTTTLFTGVMALIGDALGIHFLKSRDT